MRGTAKTKLLGLFANPADHSKSPSIFNHAFDKYNLDYTYLSFNIPEGKIEEAISAMRVLGMKGANISMPHKTAVIPYLDEVSSEAFFCNAVNTVSNDGGVLKGYNTDIYGAVKAIECMGASIRGSKVAVLGAGGAGKAVLYGLSENNPAQIKLFIRGKDAFDLGKLDESHHTREVLEYAERLIDKTGCQIDIFDVESETLLIRELAEIDILINATGIGMGKTEGKSLINSPECFSNKPYVLDVIYSPEKTEFLRLAEASGCKISNGLNMLAYQAEKAYNIMVGSNLEIDDIMEAIGK